MVFPPGNTLQPVLSIQDEILEEFRGRIDTTFAKFLEDVLEVIGRIEAGGDLTAVSAIDLRVRQRLAEALERHGFEGAVAEFQKAFAEKGLGKLVQKALKRNNVKAAFTQVDKAALEALMRTDLRKMVSVGNEFVDLVADSIVASVTGGEVQFAEYVRKVRGAALSGNLPGFFGTNPTAQVFTQANTAVAEFTQHMIGRRVTGRENQLFIFGGPADAITRPWCRERLKDNEPKTMKEIMKLPVSKTNPGGNNFVGRGGFNCRHQWWPAPKGVEVEDLENDDFKQSQ